jgi:hypothetical protein
MIVTSPQKARFLLKPYHAHKAWTFKLINITQYYSESKEELATKLVELAKFFQVPTDAFCIRDLCLGFDIVYIDGQFIPRDRLPTKKDTNE